MSWPTTRRHPRSMAEAFNDVDRAAWAEGWTRPAAARWGAPLLAVLIGVALAMVLLHWIDWSLS